MWKAVIALLVAFLPAATAASTDKGALVDELVALTQMDKVLDQLRSQVEGMVNQVSSQMQPPEGAPEAARQDIAEFQKRLMAKSLEIMDFKNIAAQVREIFVEVYNEDELTGIIQFYKSSVGRSLIAKQPLVMKRAFEMNQIKMKALIPEMQVMTTEFVEVMKKKYPDVQPGREGGRE